LYRIVRIGSVVEKISCQCVDVVEMGQRGVAKAPRLIIVIAASVTHHHVVPGFPERCQILPLQSVKH
jgi:hypothetical protein